MDVSRVGVVANSFCSYILGASLLSFSVFVLIDDDDRIWSPDFGIVSVATTTTSLSILSSPSFQLQPEMILFSARF